VFLGDFESYAVNERTVFIVVYPVYHSFKIVYMVYIYYTDTDSSIYYTYIQ